jgi:hypothetical protein
LEKPWQGSRDLENIVYISQGQNEESERYKLQAGSLFGAGTSGERDKQGEGEGERETETIVKAYELAQRDIY